MLRTAVEAAAGDAGLHHALGLVLTRLKRSDDAIAEFHRAADLDTDRARYTYVYAVALHSLGRGAEAITVLEQGLAKHPQDRDILLALITFNRDAGYLDAALEYAQRMAGLTPGDREIADLVETLQTLVRKSHGQ